MGIVLVGKPSTPTPKGSFKIKNKALNPGGPFGARWMGLTATGGSYGIHGTNNPNSIGHAASAGCVRMYNHDVIELYNTVPIGTIVNIYFNLEIALISYLILRLFLYVLELKFSYIFL